MACLAFGVLCPASAADGAGNALDLKRAGPDSSVWAIAYCAGTYTVTTENGVTRKLMEFDVRVKTDSSPRGPDRGKPVFIPAGGRGDRANIVFSSPREISGYIQGSCS